MSVTLSENDSDARRSEVRTVAAVYSAGGDSDTCEACKSMEGRSTTNLAEAAAWCPNPACTSRDGCFCMVIYEMTRLDSHDLDRFLEYAVQNGVPVSAQAVSEFYGARQAAEREESRRWSDANAPMHNAHRCEKSDPNKAASLYRQTILNLLDYSGDPLASSEVRRSLLFAFDRLTVILRRYGMKADALEEADSAASLGLLDDVEDGTKGVRERLARRRNSLRKALSAE